MKDLRPFIDECIEKMVEPFPSHQVRGFLDVVSPHIEEYDILKHIKFDPKLIVFIFKGWWSGNVFRHVESGIDGIYEVKNTVSGDRFVFHMIEKVRTEYSKTHSFGFNECIDDKLPLPQTMGDFVDFCVQYDVMCEIKDYPFQNIGAEQC